jgi:phosphoglycolate phosphatase-like HAD superfamily hydrolase
LRISRTRRAAERWEAGDPPVRRREDQARSFDVLLGREGERRVAPKKVSGASPDASARRLLDLLVTILELRSRRPPRDVTLVFDVDNTLVDTRHRTLAAAKSFTIEVDGVEQMPLAHGTVEAMDYLPADTCRRLGVDDAAVHRAFAEHFESVFWSAASFALDQAIPMPVALAKLAQRLGAQVHFLTGRTETYRKETMAKLEELGIPPASPEHLIMKGAKRDRRGRLERTERFKARHLRRLHRQRLTIAGFVSEGSRDVAYLQAHAKEVMRFLYLLFPIDEPGHTVGRKRTLRMPVDLELPSEAQVRAELDERRPR